MRSPIDAYRLELRRRLRGRPLLARRVIREIGDHLAEATAAGVRSGLSPSEGEEAAIRQLGPASVVAQRYREIGLSLGRLVIAASCATACVAIWLAFVTTIAPPLRDPTDILVLRWLAAGFMAYSVLSGTLVALGARRIALRWTAFWLSMVAIALGGLHVIPAIVAAGAGKHVDGYVLFVGAILAGHGIVTSAYVLDAPLTPSADRFE